ncbi:MAG: hypothetical protein QM768_12130 [Agriterribacter sp.]
MATDKNKHLECVLASHKIRKKQNLLDKHVEKRDEIVNALKEKYESNLYDPFNSGSYAKNTAVNKKFDFDLIAPYKRDAFDTLEKMYTAVYDFLYEKYKDVATVRKQKVSIGIEFFADSDGDVVKIDVVPGRELNQDQYKDDSKLNLYVYSQFGKIAAGSDRLRSNVKAQIQNIKDNADKTSLREIIRLLKIWKIHLGKSYKSFLIELITIKAFEKKDITGDLWERLKAVLEYIRDNVKEVSLPDPGNGNNDVADSLSDLDKGTLSDDMKYMIENIEANSDNIKSYFLVNSEFPCEEEKSSDSRYSEKAIGISIPPPKRFG